MLEHGQLDLTPTKTVGHSVFAVNGRFLRRRVTGVERYATELLKRFDSPVKTISPRGISQGIVGHTWEQLVLASRVHGNLLWSPCNTGPLLCRRQVVTIHDVIALDHPEWYDRRFCALYNWLLPRLARSVEHLIAVSEFTKKRLVERLGLADRKITVVPNGVSEQFLPQPTPEVNRVRNVLGIPPGPYVLSVGSLEPRKNFSRLLEAWERLPADYGDITLVIAGSATLAHRHAVLPSTTKRTILTDYVADRDLPGLYSGASCFVYPSLYEGFGLPILEALACGVPVVASNCTSIPEVTGNSAVLVDPMSVEDIAAGIRAALDHPSALLHAARIQAKRFSWERCARATESLLLSFC